MMEMYVEFTTLIRSELMEPWRFFSIFAQPYSNWIMPANKYIDSFLPLIQNRDDEHSSYEYNEKLWLQLPLQIFLCNA